ncbi:MAG: hypothetical protein NZL85_01385 [Fimbriimonadales bacterium]|nr:hypothetical protein [Fimbriimonadales bacterium]
MPIEDVEQRRMVLREINKRRIDTSLMDVHVIHGVVYIRGVVRPLRGQPVDLNQELEIIRRILRQKPGIRDVIIDVTIRG